MAISSAGCIKAGGNGRKAIPANSTGDNGGGFMLRDICGYFESNARQIETHVRAFFASSRRVK
ncbi:MAG: hypothetical protein QF386_06740 [Alphaproteobacteria bacterium]|jgi:hypothetical protein|nr:hypothetical protein [Alphaproteobacteria bacterium]MDP7045304.1 hypothetical protein [Alphaproteobacteria bacterium]